MFPVAECSAGAGLRRGFFIGAALAPSFIGTTVAYTPEERSLLEALESGEIIRLHVLADGDDAESQRVKLCVRDALIAAFGEMLLDASQTDADTVYETLLTHVSQMEEAALACARENGFTGPVTAEAGC